MDTLYLLGEGRLVNLAAGMVIRLIMDMTLRYRLCGALHRESSAVEARRL